MMNTFNTRRYSDSMEFAFYITVRLGLNVTAKILDEATVGIRTTHKRLGIASSINLATLDYNASLAYSV